MAADYQRLADLMNTSYAGDILSGQEPAAIGTKRELGAGLQNWKMAQLMMQDRMRRALEDAQWDAQMAGQEAGPMDYLSLIPSAAKAYTGYKAYSAEKKKKSPNSGVQ